MSVPAAVNHPCQPARMKHRRRRPPHSLTCQPTSITQEMAVVSPELVLGFAWAPRHPSQHHAGKSLVLRDGSTLENSGSCWQSEWELGMDRQQQHQPHDHRAGTKPLAHLPQQCPLPGHHGDMGCACFTQAKELEHPGKAGGEHAASIHSGVFPRKDLWKDKRKPIK